jgi:hypothetical protein
MTARDKRRLDMVVRLRAFCAEHPGLFESARDFQKTLADLDAAITELRTHLQAQDSGLASFHESVRRRTEARTALRRGLESIRTFAATLNAVGLDEKFRLRHNMSDAALVVRARSFAGDAAPIADALAARGLPAGALTDLPAQIGALEQAMAACGEQRRTHVGARAGIDAALRSTAAIAKMLDAIVLRGAKRDAATVAAWKNVRRIGPAKVTEGGEPTPAPAPAADRTSAKAA